MSIRPVTYWQAVCDRCGCVDDSGEFSAWSDPEGAELHAGDCDWTVGRGDDEFPEGRVLCPDCVEWSDDGFALVEKPASAVTP